MSGGRASDPCLAGERGLPKALPSPEMYDGDPCRSTIGRRLRPTSGTSCRNSWSESRRSSSKNAPMEKRNLDGGGERGPGPIRVRDPGPDSPRVQAPSEHWPVIEFDLVEDRIYACPYAGYRSTLSEKSKALLDGEYRDAKDSHQIVVFVKDTGTRRLISFSIDEDSEERGERGGRAEPELTTGSCGPCFQLGDESGIVLNRGSAIRKWREAVIEIGTLATQRLMEGPYDKWISRRRFPPEPGRRPSAIRWPPGDSG